MSNVLKLSGITLPGSGYPSLSSFVTPTFPVATGLAGLYVLGGSLPFSLLNRANSSSPLTAVGSPTVNSVGATLSQANCFSTGMTSTSDLTIIAVAKPMATSAGGMIVSNYLNSNPNQGDSLFFIDTVTMRGAGNVSTGLANSAVSISGDNNTQWNSYAMRAKSTGQVRAWKQKSGVLTAGTETGAATRALQSRTLRIGGHYESAQFQGNVEVLMVAIFNAALSDADIAQNLAYLNSTFGPALEISTL